MWPSHTYLWGTGGISIHTPHSLHGGGQCVCTTPYLREDRDMAVTYTSLGGLLHTHIPHSLHRGGQCMYTTPHLGEYRDVTITYTLLVGQGRGRIHIHASGRGGTRGLIHKDITHTARGRAVCAHHHTCRGGQDAIISVHTPLG